VIFFQISESEKKYTFSLCISLRVSLRISLRSMSAPEASLFFGWKIEWENIKDYFIEKYLLSLDDDKEIQDLFDKFHVNNFRITDCLCDSNTHYYIFGIPLPGSSFSIRELKTLFETDYRAALVQAKRMKVNEESPRLFSVLEYI
jgi:hypothetical protein